MSWAGRALHAVAPFLRYVDVQVTRWSKSYEYQRARYIRDLGLTLVVDIGANQGQAALEFRAHGYRGRLLSIEPQEDAFRVLAGRAARDSMWDCLKCGIGDHEGEADLGVSDNSYSSSILPILAAHVNAAPESKYESTERVVIRTLDSVMASIGDWRGPIGLKLDVQGYEAEVLRGAKTTLSHVALLESELSLVPLYGGQVLYEEMIKTCGALGFSLINMRPAFSDPRTGRVLQFDGMFARELEWRA